MLTYVERPLGESLVNYSAPNNHLLNTLLAHLSMSLFSNASWAIRLPAVLAGILTIPASFAVGRALDSWEAGLLAAALTASSVRLVGFSAQTRGYALQGVLLLAMVLVAAGTRRATTTAWWIVGDATRRTVAARACRKACARLRETGRRRSAHVAEG